MSTKKFSITTNVSPEIEAYLEGHFPVKQEDFRDDETVQRPVRRVHRRDSEFRRTCRREARERYLMVKDIKRARYDADPSKSRISNGRNHSVQVDTDTDLMKYM